METIIPFVNKKKLLGEGGDQAPKISGKSSAKDDSQMVQALNELIQEYLDNDSITKKVDTKILELSKSIKGNNNAEALASKVGCTFRYTQQIKIHQPMYRCQVCKIDVCLTCAILHHVPNAAPENSGANLGPDGNPIAVEDVKNLEQINEKDQKVRYYCAGGKQNMRCKPPAAPEQQNIPVIPDEDFIKYYKLPANEMVGFEDTVYHERLQTYKIPAFINDLTKGLGFERYTERDI